MSFSLQDTKNYHNEFHHKTTEIFAQYTTLILEYLQRFSESIKYQDQQYYNYIINRGIQTMSHVFKIILLYTKNIDIASHYTQRAYYYFVEFIGQIGEESHSYLQLNSKDAALFVYKKTIFDINNDFKKNYSADTSNVMNNVDVLINIYNAWIYEHIYNSCTPIKTTIDLIYIINHSIKKHIQLLLNLSLVKDGTLYNDHLKLVYLITSNIKPTDIKKKYAMIELLLKKLRQHSNININLIKKRCIQTNILEKYGSLTHSKYVNWLVFGE